MIGKAHVVLIDFADHALLIGRTAVVRNVVMAVWDGEVSIAAITPGVGVHEAADSRRVRLKSQHHHVHQEFYVLAIFLRDTDRARIVFDTFLELFKLVCRM